MEKTIKKLSKAFDRTFTEENLLEQIRAMLDEKDVRIADLENQLQKKRKAQGIVTGEDVLMSLKSKGVET